MLNEYLLSIPTSECRVCGVYVKAFLFTNHSEVDFGIALVYLSKPKYNISISAHRSSLKFPEKGLFSPFS